MRAPDLTLGPFRERNTVVIRAIVKDVSDPPVPIPGSELATITWTLYSEHGDEAIINNRDHVTLADGVDESGNLELILEPDDMAIVDAAARATDALTNKALERMEYHRLLIEWSWVQTGLGSPAPTAEANMEMRVIVRDLNLVPV